MSTGNVQRKHQGPPTLTFHVIHGEKHLSVKNPINKHLGSIQANTGHASLSAPPPTLGEARVTATTYAGHTTALTAAPSNSSRGAHDHMRRANFRNHRAICCPWLASLCSALAVHMTSTGIHLTPHIPLACGHRLRPRSLPLQMLHTSRTRVAGRFRRQHVVQAASPGFSSDDPYKA